MRREEDPVLPLTDFAPRAGGVLVDQEDIWSCSEPDEKGEVTAIVVVGGAVLQVKGRRVFGRGSNERS